MAVSFSFYCKLADRLGYFFFLLRAFASAELIRSNEILKSNCTHFHHIKLTRTLYKKNGMAENESRENYEEVKKKQIIKYKN